MQINIQSVVENWQADCVIVPVLAGTPFLQNIPVLGKKLPWLNEAVALNDDFKGKKGESCLVYGSARTAQIVRVLFCGLGKTGDFKLTVLRDAVAAAVKSCAGLKLAQLALPLEALEALARQLPEQLPSLPVLLEEALLGAKLAVYSCDLYRGKPTVRANEESNRKAEGEAGAGVVASEAESDGSSEIEKNFKPASLDLLCPAAGLPAAALTAIRKAGALAHGICQARDLINGPANIVTPARLEEKAQELARTYGFSCTSLGPDYLRDFGFGAFWGVARGSAEEPRLIILEYKPQGGDTDPSASSATPPVSSSSPSGAYDASSSDDTSGGSSAAPADSDRPIIIVGKGVTFDSGGLSIKPSAKMHEMKSDMAGAGAVLGLFAALGEALLCKDEALLLKDEALLCKDETLCPEGRSVQDSLGAATEKCGLGADLTAKHVIGIIPCTDNMPDGNAYRPGDILTTLSGRTVEIISTDAEGRLLLCDCLTLAQQRWKPAALIDVATLTGACVVALGEHTTGLFGNDAALRDRLLDLGERASERFWPLPIYDEDIEGLKSDVADLRNTGPREGGALFAALFLKQFIEPGTVWAHLDIAGPAYSNKKTPTSPGGASGVALRTLFELVMN